MHDAVGSSDATTVDALGVAPRLTDKQLEALGEHGRRRRTEAGEVLVRQGEAPTDFFAILDGEVEIVEGYCGEDERLITTLGPGRFLGELDLLTGQVVFATAVVRQPGEVIVVPVE